MNFHKFSNGIIVNLDYVATAIITQPTPQVCLLELRDATGNPLAWVPVEEFEKVAFEKKEVETFFRPFERAVRDFCAAVNRMPSSLRVHY